MKEWDNLPTRRAIKIYQELGLEIGSNAKVRPEPKLKREILGWLVAMMQYQATAILPITTKGLSHEEAEMQCKCGAKMGASPPIFFNTPTAHLHRAKLFSMDKKKPLSPSEIL